MGLFTQNSHKDVSWDMGVPGSSSLCGIQKNVVSYDSGLWLALRL